MTRFDLVKQILDDAVNGQTIGAHRAFWRGTTRDQFVAKIVFGKQLLVIGDGSSSNLIKALRGESPFGADLPTPPPGAIFNRMPANRPPVATEKIELIRQWIDDGCPEGMVVEGGLPPDVVDVTGGGPVEPLLHTKLWRDFDNWAAYEVTADVDDAIGTFFTASATWRAFASGTEPESAWQNTITEAGTRAAIDLLAEGQYAIFASYFGQTIPLLTLLDAFERFGDNSLPDDPLRPADRRHNMNGQGMWLIWSAFADACLRLAIRPNFWPAMARGLLLGMLNDGLFRGRLQVTGFSADLAGKVALRQHVRQLADSQLRDELVRRFLESGIAR